MKPALIFRGLSKRMPFSRDPFAPGVIVHYTRRPSVWKRFGRACRRVVRAIWRWL